MENLVHFRVFRRWFRSSNSPFCIAQCSRIEFREGGVDALAPTDFVASVTRGSWMNPQVPALRPIGRIANRRIANDEVVVRVLECKA